MVFIYSTILRYLAQIIKGNKRLCYKEVISYSITKKLHIYGMNICSLIIVWTNIKSKIWLDYTNSISTSIAASPLRGPILTILV